MIKKKNSSPTPHPHNFTNGLHLRADNPTHPLLNPSFFPWFAQDPIPGASLWHVHQAHHLPHFSWPYYTPILMMHCTTFLSHYSYMYDWLILLRWGSLELLQGTFLYVISGRGLVNNNCQENGINEDNYCNGRIGNLIEEPLKMAIVRTWFFVWKKSPAYLFNHEERQNPTEVDLFGQINTCTS